MKDGQIKESMQNIRMSEEAKNELWIKIIKKSERQKHVRQKAAVAAAILALLVIPTGAYAASRFGWVWNEVEEKNEQLNADFKYENGYTEAAGFRFCIERAMCDTNMGVVYYYISVTDISGQDRNPRDYSFDFHEDSKHFRVDDIVYDIGIQGDSTGTYRFDEKNSTSKRACFYLESEASAKTENADKVKIGLTKIDKVYSGGKTIGVPLKDKIIKIKNKTQLPTLTWQLKERGNMSIKVSPIMARISTASKPAFNFEIVLKDNSSIKDYFDFNQAEVDKDGTLPENSFTSKSKENEDDDTIYRYHYMELSKISGIRIDGEFYPVENADELTN